MGVGFKIPKGGKKLPHYSYHRPVQGWVSAVTAHMAARQEMMVMLRDMKVTRAIHLPRNGARMLRACPQHPGLGLTPALCRNPNNGQWSLKLVGK